jgi:hypothetical protein
MTMISILISHLMIMMDDSSSWLAGDFFCFFTSPSLVVVELQKTYVVQQEQEQQIRNNHPSQNNQDKQLILASTYHYPIVCLPTHVLVCRPRATRFKQRRWRGNRHGEQDNSVSIHDASWARTRTAQNPRRET